MPTTGTSDYFNSCSLDLSPDGELAFNVPENYFGFQTARTGNGYAGYYADLSIDNNNYYEYMCVKLSNTLINGKIYELSYYVSLADSFYTSGLPQQFIDHSAAYFSIDSLAINNYDKITQTPQVASTKNVFLNDSLGWQKISGYFIANGDESYLTLGCFKNYSDVQINFINELTGQHAVAYYFVDDVSLFETELFIPNVITPNGDGINDYFEILISEVDFKIMNRWENLVFDSKVMNVKTWDGNFNGQNSVEGIYFYVIEELNLKGFIELIR